MTTAAQPVQDQFLLTIEQIDLIAKKYAGMGGVEDYRSFAQEIAARATAAHQAVITAKVIAAAVAVADNEYEQYLPQAGMNNGRDSDFAFGSVNSAERIGGRIRKIGDGFGVSLVEKAALICDSAAKLLVDAPATAIFECAERIRELKLVDDLNESELIEQAARICDSSGHHWSGKPALIMFECAEAIRALNQPIQGDDE